jgi:TldD protein
MRRPARCRWCWGRAGRACCCTRRWATAWRATSTARAPPPTPGAWASGWRAGLCTIVDDGTLAGRRGSLSIDDEGTPTQCTTLIENGVLVGYMQDTLNARLMGMAPTGNGRRESFAHLPMPRMTNTYMLAGEPAIPAEIIRGEEGLYAVNFGGGQVDITSGKFVFSATEAYLIEDGKVTAPVKGATLIGNGPEP